MNTSAREPTIDPMLRNLQSAVNDGPTRAEKPCSLRHSQSRSSRSSGTVGCASEYEPTPTFSHTDDEGLLLSGRLTALFAASEPETRHNETLEHHNSRNASPLIAQMHQHGGSHSASNHRALSEGPYVSPSLIPRDDPASFHKQDSDELHLSVSHDPEPHVTHGSSSTTVAAPGVHHDSALNDSVDLISSAHDELLILRGSNVGLEKAMEFLHDNRMTDVDAILSGTPPSDDAQGTCAAAVCMSAAHSFTKEDLIAAHDAEINKESRFAAEVQEGLNSGDLQLTLCTEGEGGTYLVKRRTDSGSTVVAVFKPGCEEVGCAENPKGNTTEPAKEGFVAGEGFSREVLAYLLDRDDRAGVPETVNFSHNGVVGSLQRFVPRCRESWNTNMTKVTVQRIQDIAMFDLKVMNADRHGGNILVPENDNTTVVPIDHAYILPSEFSEPDYEWIMWQQAKQPFTAESLAYIAALDVDDDIAVLRKHLPRDDAGAEDFLRIGTTLLKVAAPRGYTPRELGEFCRRQRMAQPSGLEDLLASSRRSLDEGGELCYDTLKQLLETKYFPPKTA